MWVILIERESCTSITKSSQRQKSPNGCHRGDRRSTQCRSERRPKDGKLPARTKGIQNTAKSSCSLDREDRRSQPACSKISGCMSFCSSIFDTLRLTIFFPLYPDSQRDIISGIILRSPRTCSIEYEKADRYIAHLCTLLTTWFRISGLITKGWNAKSKFLWSVKRWIFCSPANM